MLRPTGLLGRGLVGRSVSRDCLEGWLSTLLAGLLGREPGRPIHLTGLVGPKAVLDRALKSGPSDPSTARTHESGLGWSGPMKAQHALGSR